MLRTSPAPDPVATEPVAPLTPQLAESEAEAATDEAPWRSAAWATAGCALAGLAAAGAHGAGAPSLATGLFALSYLAGGRDATVRALRTLREGAVHVDLLMILAAAGAALVGHWAEGAVLLFLFSLGNTLEAYAFHRTRRSIQGLVALRPDTASRIGADGSEHTVPSADLVVGDRVRIRPGERIPIDGRVVEGRSSIDESTLTGEPVPVSKKADDLVFAGTLNEGGSLDVVVERGAGETTLARVIRMVEEARERQAPTQTWLEQTEGRYAAFVIAGAAVATVLPVVAFGWTWGESFFRAMTLLVVASPCALVISIPATIVSAVSNAARHGILFKGGGALDTFADVRAIALDKTGTVTRGRPELDGVFSLLDDDPSGQVLLRWTAAVEARSEHHLGRAIVDAARAAGLGLPDPGDFEAVTGKGVVGILEGHEVAVGRVSWIEERTGTSLPTPLAKWLREKAGHGGTPMAVALDGRVAGGVSVADRVRDGAADAIERLRGLGIERIVLLTGDDSVTAEAVARTIGVDAVHSELLPEDKVSLLESLRRAHGVVAMVGDGVNDAPALAAADVGIALGVAGTDVALETADLVLMGERLDGLVYARRLAGRARRVVRQNLVFASGVLVTLVVLALFGVIGLTTGVIGHEGSTLIVVLNGLRLLRGGPPRASPA